MVAFTSSRSALRWQVTVATETSRGVSDGPLGGVAGRRARATASASVTVDIAGLPPSPSGASLSELSAVAGAPVRADSVLIVHAGETCRRGVDTDHLSNGAKVAIIRSEAFLAGALPLATGFRSEDYLRADGVAVPALSPATRGDELVLAIGSPDAGIVLTNLGLCRRGSGFVVPTSLACTGDLSALVSVRTRLIPNP